VALSRRRRWWTTCRRWTRHGHI